MLPSPHQFSRSVFSCSFLLKIDSTFKLLNSQLMSNFQFIFTFILDESWRKLNFLGIHCLKVFAFLVFPVIVFSISFEFDAIELIVMLLISMVSLPCSLTSLISSVNNLCVGLFSFSIALTIIANCTLCYVQSSLILNIVLVLLLLTV